MKQNGAVCQPGIRAFFFIFRFEYLLSGPKRYRDFRETWPQIFKQVGDLLIKKRVRPAK